MRVYAEKAVQLYIGDGVIWCPCRLFCSSGESRSRVEMARKIFVGSLPSAVTEDLLRSEFDRFGRIDEVFIKDMVAL